MRTSCRNRQDKLAPSRLLVHLRSLAHTRTHARTHAHTHDTHNVLYAPCFASVSALSFPEYQNVHEPIRMDVSTSFWLCSLLAVVSLFVTIGCCLWCRAVYVRWLGLLTLRLCIWLCSSCTGDWGCHSRWKCFESKSVLPLFLHYIVVTTLSARLADFSARFVCVLDD